MSLTDKLVELATNIGNDIGNLFSGLSKVLAFFNPGLAITKSVVNTDGISTTLTYKRADNTIYKTSILSGGTSPEFTTRTLTYYAEDGTTVKETKVYALSYTNGRCSCNESDGLIDIEEHGINVLPYFKIVGDNNQYQLTFVKGLSNGNKEMAIDEGLYYNPATNILTALGDFTTSSDRRLKTDIKVIKDPIDRIMEIRGVTYTRKDNGKKQAGVIAQEVMKVLPEAVNTEGEFLSVSHGNIVGLLVESIKELKRAQDKTNALVVKQGKEIKALKSQLSKLGK